MMAGDGLLTTGEAARYLVVAGVTMANWRRDGRGPAWVRVGRQVRYRRDDLDAYIRACRHVPADL